MNTALIIIDMQNDFIEAKSLLEVKGIRKQIPKLKKLINQCRKKGILIIYTRHLFSFEENPIEGKLFPQYKNGGLRDGTPGADIYTEIKPSKEDLVIDKHRYDAFIGTSLESILKKKGIKQLIITGTMTEVCSESTARTAMMKDFDVIFCSDLNFTSDQKTHQNTLRIFSKHFGKVLTSDEIIRTLIFP